MHLEGIGWRGTYRPSRGPESASEVGGRLVSPGVVQVPQKLEHDQKKGERKYISVPRLYHLDGACNTRSAPKRSQGPLVPWSLKEVG